MRKGAHIRCKQQSSIYKVSSCNKLFLILSTLNITTAQFHIICKYFTKGGNIQFRKQCGIHLERKLTTKPKPFFLSLAKISLFYKILKTSPQNEELLFQKVVQIFFKTHARDFYSYIQLRGPVLEKL